MAESKNAAPSWLHSLVLVVGIAEPVMTIPQIWRIWAEHQTAGLSLWTWSFYIGGSLVWLAYGLKIKDKPIITTGALWIVFAGAVALGIVLN